MDDAKLREELRRAGMEWFAEYYLELSGSAPDNELVERCIADKGYTLNSARTKVSAGRRILHAGQGKGALILITHSKNERASVFAQALLMRGIEN